MVYFVVVMFSVLIINLVNWYVVECVVEVKLMFVMIGKFEWFDNDVV